MINKSQFNKKIEKAASATPEPKKMAKKDPAPPTASGSPKLTLE
jgi:hypothetical protein